MLWEVHIEAEIADRDAAQVEAAARRALERFEGVADLDGSRLRVVFKLESPSVKRAARAAFVIFGRIARRPERADQVRAGP